MKTPICPAYSEEEAAQTFALFYYTIYHAECLMTPIGDTMSPLLQAVYQTIWEVRDDCYAAIYNKIPSLQSAQRHRAVRRSLSFSREREGVVLFHEGHRVDRYDSGAGGHGLERIACRSVGSRCSF